MSIKKRLFGSTENGTDVYLYEIKNSSGASAEILTYGGTLNALKMPSAQGKLVDVVLGFDDMEGHEQRSSYQGQLVGRYANRIANGEFTVGGKTYSVVKNEDGITCLHGGGALSHAVWTAQVVGENVLRLQLLSPEGENGFPGEMNIEVTYTLTESNELVIDYLAVCSEESVINLTNHAYFNLGGFDSGDVLSHKLTINADAFTPTDKLSIPTGEIRPVAGTAFDFTSPKTIRRDIFLDDEQLTNCLGYDHNFCLNDRMPDEPAVTARCDSTGIVMELFTDLPGVQLYTGNFLKGESGKAGTQMKKHAGFCLETQYYPDTPNQPEFPQCTFAAGESFKSRTSYKFSNI